MSQRVIKPADAAPPKASTLPAKEAALFKQIAKFYDARQHKKALKAADAVLKKFPDHGETLSMKALVMSQMPGFDGPRKEEAMELAKKGLRNDLKSSVCWHVLGLLHRHSRSHPEAAKAYLNALRFDPSNLQIVRDLTSLQIQLRDFDGFNESQHKLLEMRPGVRMHWLGLAVSYHLLGDFAQAVKVLEAWNKTNRESRTGALTHDNKMEDQEIELYRCFVLEESGDLEGAVRDLEKFAGEGGILDRVTYESARVRIYMKLGNKSKASEAIHAMLKLNPDDAELYTQLEATLEDPSPENLLSHYLELEKSYPRSTAVRFRILELLDVASPEWASRAAGELQKGFRKGVPSLFTSIEKLWASNPAKKTWIKAAVATYAAELEKSGRFPGSEEQEPPTAFPWALLFLALLLDSDGDQSEALATIDRAIEHTPTLVDLHMVRGRILKHSGRLSDASEALETARGMDLQDRFVNTKSAKYLLRLGEYAKAEDVVRLFIKDGDVKDLVELQVIWFATEAAESWARKGEWGKAVGRWYQIEKHFSDFFEDQFDYHQYCLRRMTMRNYIEMLRFEDRLRSHPYFFRAAIAATKALLFLHDNPEIPITAAQRLEKEMENLSVADRKKAVKKADKEKEKADKGKEGKKEEEFDGEKILEGAKGDLLAEATKIFVKPLLEQSPGRVESQILGAEVYIRRKKHLLAVRSLLAGLKIAPENPDLHRLAARLHVELAASPSENALVREVVEEGMKKVFPDFPKTDLKAWNAEWAKRNAGVEAAVAAAQSAVILDPSSAATAAQGVVDAIASTKPTLKQFLAAHEALKRMDSKAADAALAAGKARWPEADYFKVLATEEAK